MLLIMSCLVGKIMLMTDCKKDGPPTLPDGTKCHLGLSQTFRQLFTRMVIPLVLCYPSIFIIPPPLFFASGWVSIVCIQKCLDYYNSFSYVYLYHLSLGHFYFNDFLILNHSIVAHDLWELKAVFTEALDQVVGMEVTGSFWRPNL